MQILTFLILIFNICLTLFFYQTKTHSSFFNYFYNLSYGLNFFLATIISFTQIRKYPIYKKPLVLITFSYCLFSFAQSTWIYYNLFLRQDVPYPSIADYFWIAFYIVIFVGFILLLQALSSKITAANTVEAVVISTITFLILSSFLSLNTNSQNLSLLTKVLNYSYPVWDSILISLGIATLRSASGKINPHLLYYIFGFMSLAVGDTIFAYQTSNQTYWNGNIADLFYALAGFSILMATINIPRLLEYNQHYQQEREVLS